MCKIIYQNMFGVISPTLDDVSQMFSKCLQLKSSMMSYQGTEVALPKTTPLNQALWKFIIKNYLALID